MSQVIDPMEAEPLEAILVDTGPTRTAATAVAWIVLGLVAALVFWFTWTQVISPSGGTSVDSYIDGDSGYLYESLKDQFRAEFPTTPRRRQESGEFGPTVIVDSRPGPDYRFAVIRQPEPESGLENYTTTLDNAARELVQESGGTFVSQIPALPLAVSSVAVKDIVYRKGEDYYRNRLILATDRMYTLQVKVKGPDDAAFTALAKTFKVLGPRLSLDLDAFDPKGTYGAAALDYAAAEHRWQFISDRALAPVQLRAGQRVLDVACGPGGTALAAASAVGPRGEVVAVDIASEMLAILQERAAHARLTNITVVEHDMSTIDELAPGIGPFDAVLCVLGLFFADDMVRAARSMWSHVRPGGVLGITTLGPDLFAPLFDVFSSAVRSECPDLEVAFHRVAQSGATSSAAVLDDAGIPDGEMQEEEGHLRLEGPDDWWQLVMGTGLRRFVTGLDPDVAGRVRARTGSWIVEHGITSVRMDAVHATIRRAG